VYRESELEQLRKRIEQLERKNEALQRMVQDVKKSYPGSNRPCNHPDCNCHIDGYYPLCQAGGAICY